jgi:hypothetical protein
MFPGLSVLACYDVGKLKLIGFEARTMTAEIDLTDPGWPDNYLQLSAALDRDCRKHEEKHEEKQRSETDVKRRYSVSLPSSSPSFAESDSLFLPFERFKTGE